VDAAPVHHADNPLRNVDFAVFGYVGHRSFSPCQLVRKIVMTKDLSVIVDQFHIQERFLSAMPYGSGHINETFWVKTHPPGSESYILQKINHRIFTNVPKLMENICRVTSHLRSKILAEGGNPKRECLTVISTPSGQPFYQDPEGNFWRMYIFLEKTLGIDIVETPQQAAEGGKAFGKFQRFLADLPGGPLFETIPHFHDIDARLSKFKATCQEDPSNRLKEVSAEVDFILDLAPELREVLLLGNSGQIPVRVTHNDTKFNNVLLDENDHGLCVIDLDTVMPGYLHYDYSDSIRTATNTAAEDEADLSKIDMNLDLFEAYTKGFLSEVGPTLNAAEWATLGRSAKLLPFIIGLRFLTDYLDGDHYFKIKFPRHNLQRARAQFQLTRKIISHEPHILTYIKSLEARYGRV
jgi:hypothetical protein